jgi:AcrR family transcriptional regulator
MNFLELLELTGGYKKKPSQARSNKTVEDLHQCAKEIFESETDEEFSTKLLSEKSGYSAGVIYRYFNKFEDIFLKIFFERANQHIIEVQEIYLNHKSTENIDLLIEKIVGHGFSSFFSRSLSVKKLHLIFRFAMRRLKNPDIIFTFNDFFVSHMMDLQKNDKTNSFETMDEMECISRLRAFDLFMRVPYITSNNNKFSFQEHKKSCIKFGVQIFSKHSDK